MLALLRWLLVWPDARPVDAPARTWFGWVVTTLQGLLGLSTWRRTDGSCRGPFVWLLRSVQGLIVRVALLVALLATTAYVLLRGSLPDVDGSRTFPGLVAEVTIERDALGIPTITAGGRRDLFAGLGYVHAQERFFQMDLSRRYAGGELAALLGPALLRVDESIRPLRLRETVRKLVKRLTPAQRGELDAYVWGVNAGLKNLRVRPFEYLLLQSLPEPWTVEDSGLVVLSITLMLQDDNWLIERFRDAAHQSLPPSLYALLDARGTSWDAPLDESGSFDTPRLPTPLEFDLRTRKQPLLPEEPRAEPPPRGSNNWALGGNRTKHGGAILANDMHLPINVPNTWYRAGLVWPGRDGLAMKAWGATYPGTPGMVVGSNRHVAWGLTNAEIDTADLVRLEPVPNDDHKYRTPDGSEAYEEFDEELKVRGEPSRTLTVRWTRWGPVLPADPRYALHWVAHQPEGFTLGWLDLLEARDLDDLFATANRIGGPHQNFVAADKSGKVGWTILGRVPNRVGFDGRLPVSWADGKHRWDGFLDPKDNPRLVNVTNDRIWTANNRVVGGEALTKICEAGFDRGARACQIREGLCALDKPAEDEVFAIALDDRAVFLARWRELLLQVLGKTATDDAEGLAWMVRETTESADRAGVDCVGYRLVTEFREQVSQRVLDPLTAECKQKARDFNVGYLRQREGAVWKLVQVRPEHLIDPVYQGGWDELLSASALDVLARARKSRTGLAGYTWGARNVSRVEHPLGSSLAKVPYLGGWLVSWVNMPARGLPGAGSDMPRIQSQRAGASERMTVSPGKEELGYFHMPCGQSGHPLSPHYRDMHEAWMNGTPTPFLPGPTVHTLILKPRE